MVKEHLVSPHDLTLFRHFHDVDKAVYDLKHFYNNYHSSRFLKDRYLIRFRKPLSAKQFTKLNEEFKDILSGGSFELLQGSLDEDDNKDTSLQRLKFHFDRSSYARLRHLIDYLNSL